jgi:hypothetical protein
MQETREYIQHISKPNDLEQLNFERIMLDSLSEYENLIDNYDLPEIMFVLGKIGVSIDSPVFVLSENDYADFTEFRQSLSLANGFEDIPSGVIIVKREKALELENGGNLYTNGIIAHEIGHRFCKLHSQMSTKRLIIQRHGNAILNTQTGFFDNVIVEEGFAEYMRDYYLKRHWEHNPISQEYDYPNTLIRIRDDSGQYLTTPSSLIYKKGELGWFRASKALGCIKLLEAKVPDFIKLFVNSRTSLEGLRVFANSIESIESGLYPRVRRTQYGDNKQLSDLTKYLIDLHN